MRPLRLSSIALVILMTAVLAGCDTSNDPEGSSVVAGSSSAAEDKKISHPPEGYSLSVHSQKLDGGRVRLEFTTNIPGTIEIMAGISLSGQEPDDTWIGKNERVRLVDGSGQTTLDVKGLPAGEYDVEAAFYPRWGFQDEESRSSGVDEQLEDKHPISITGSGEPAELVAQRNKNQKWVMENVVMGAEWEPDFWRRRFGEWDEFPVKTRNPAVISNYYFKSLDMTLIVNTLKNEIVVWRMGRDGL